jgi:hypothetical protein
MRYAEGITINKDMILCKPIKRRASAKELFKIDDFMKEKCVKWSDYVGVCMDAVIRSVNYIKTCPLKSRLFTECARKWHSRFTVILGCQEEM